MEEATEPAIDRYQRARQRRNSAGCDGDLIRLDTAVADVLARGRSRRWKPGFSQ